MTWGASLPTQAEACGYNTVDVNNFRGYVFTSTLHTFFKTDMGEPFGKASACLREAASAKAGANL